MLIKSMLTAVALAASVSHAAESLRSVAIKRSVCSAVAMELYPDVDPFNERACLAGTFTIAGTTRDRRTNAVTLMDIDYRMAFSGVSLTGRAQVAATQTPDRQGRMVQTWTTRSTRTTAVGPTDIIQAIVANVNSDDNGIDTGNGGDYGISRQPRATVASLSRELQRELPSRRGSCEYETYEGIDSTLSDEIFVRAIEQNSLLGRQLEQAKRQGKIKAGVHRVNTDGESEYCSLWSFKILFTDGHVLSISVNGTT